MFSSVRVALIKKYVFFWHQQVSNMDYSNISNIMPIFSFFFFLVIVAYHFKLLWDYSEYHSFPNLIFS